MDTTALVHSFLLADVLTEDWTWLHRNWQIHCLRNRLLVSAWLSFLSKGTNTKPVGQMKDKTLLSSVVFSLRFAQSNGHLVSAKTVVFMFVSCFYL